MLIQHRLRRAFTLVELLLVLGIAMIVLALIIPATMTIFQTVRETQTRAEIKSLDEACEAFKFKYGRYPPSHVLLREKGGYRADDDPDEGHSSRVALVFKGIDPNLYETSRGKEWHDWNGNGEVDEGYVLLAGYECLVFFLGGIPEYDLATDQVRMTGFNMDSTRPTRKSNGSTRSGPFFEFEPSRLVIVPYPKDTPKETYPFPVYRDPFGTPYMYYCASQLTKNHAKEWVTNNGDCTGAGWLWENLGKYGSQPVPHVYISDPGTIVKPGEKPLVKYYEPKRFQIISAGADRSFGGGLWPRVHNQGDEYPEYRHRRDDLTNFCEGRIERLK